MDRKVFYDEIRSKIFRGRLKEKQFEGLETILDYWESWPLDLTDYRMLAYVLATTYHETAHTMQPIYERGRKSYFNKYDKGTRIGRALGNTVKGDGYKYRGRGYVQLTGRANYAKMAKILNLDLVDNPDIALDPDGAVQIIFEGMMAGKSFRGDFTGKHLGHYFTTSKTDWVGARRIVNGTDRASLIAAYARRFHHALDQATLPLKSPQALMPVTRSRTMTASMAGGAVGFASVGSAVYEIVGAADEATDRAADGTIYGIVIGSVLLLGAVYVAYVRWDDAGKPSLNEIIRGTKTSKVEIDVWDD